MRLPSSRSITFLLTVDAILTCSAFTATNPTVDGFSATWSSSSSSATILGMAGFGGGGGGAKTKKKSKKSKQRANGGDDKPRSFDAPAAYARSERLYDRMMLESFKRQNDDDDQNNVADDRLLVTSEYVVAAKRDRSTTTFASSVSDWIPVAQLCVERARGRDDDETLVSHAVSAQCREIHHAATIAAPVFSSVPRNDVRYSVEPLESFHRHVYNVVLEAGSSDNSVSGRSNDNDEDDTVVSSLERAREVLGVDAGSTDASEFKRAYRTLSFKHHPDRFVVADDGDDDDAHEAKKAAAESDYRRVKNAYEFVLRSGVTARRTTSSSLSSDNGNITVGRGWYEALGGRDRTDFRPIKLVQLQDAQKGMERCLQTEGGYRSAIFGLDPEIVMAFVARNQANALMSK